MAEKLVIDNEDLFWNGTRVDVADVPKTTDKAVCLGLDHLPDMWTPKDDVCLVQKTDGRYEAYVPDYVIKSYKEKYYARR